MRINWVSNAAWCASGYGNQTRLFVDRLKAAGHDMAVTAFWGLEGGILDMNGVRYYPKGYHPYGLDVLSAHSQHFGADIVVTLIDAWVIETQYIAPGVRWVPWFPVDHEPIPPAVRDRVRPAYARLVYSRFAERACNDAGLDCIYIPHGVDAQLYRPKDRSEARAALAWPNDRYIVGMVAANKGNPSRKAFCQNIAAFAELKRKHSDAMLYLHTVAGPETQGINLPEYIASLGLRYGEAGRCDPAAVDVLICNQYTNLLGFPDGYMTSLYNALDVLLSVSMGEGFGIPILEAQACGTPVIVGDWTAMPELCFSGWKIAKNDADPYWTPLAAYQYMPRVRPIAHALESAYRKAGNAAMREAARAGAIAYDADRVMAEYWQPALEMIQRDIDAWKAPAEATA